MNDDSRMIQLAQQQILDSERLILRKITLADAADIFEFWSDPEMARETNTTTDSQLAQTQARIVNYFIPQGLKIWALESKASHKMLGFIELHPQGDQADLGWMLNRRFWGQGFMPEAARVICDLAFKELELDILTASCNASNHNSARVMEKIGMTKLGHTYAYFKNASHLAAYYALTRTEYLEKIINDKEKFLGVNKF